MILGRIRDGLRRRRAYLTRSFRNGCEPSCAGEVTVIPCGPTYGMIYATLKGAARA